MANVILPKENEKKSVWISCRAKAGCEGKMAVMVFKQKLPEGGQVIRYRCMTCRGSFHIRI